MYSSLILFPAAGSSASAFSANSASRLPAFVSSSRSLSRVCLMSSMGTAPECLTRIPRVTRSIRRRRGRCYLRRDDAKVSDQLFVGRLDEEPLADLHPVALELIPLLDLLGIA